MQHNKKQTNQVAKPQLVDVQREFPPVWIFQGRSLGGIRKVIRNVQREY